MLMRKTFLLSVLLLAAVTSFAQTYHPDGEVNAQKEISFAKSYQTQKAFQPTATASHSRNAKRNVDMITEQPAGKLMLMKRSGVEVLPGYGAPIVSDYNIKGTYVVMGDDGNVYFKNYITNMANGGTWIKGIKEGDLVTIPLKQVSCHLWYYGYEYTYYLYAMKKVQKTGTDEWTGETYTYDTWEPDSSVESIAYRMADDGSMTLDSSVPDSLLLGGVLGEDGSWPGYGDMNCSFTPLSDTPNVLPEDIQMTNYVFTDYAWNGSISNRRFVKGAVQDDTLYVQGFSSLLPNSIIKASIKGNKAYIENNQFLGVDSVYSTLCYLKTCSYDWVNDEGWVTVTNYEAPQVELNVDADKGIYAADTNSIVVNAGKDEILLHEGYLKPSFQKYIEKAAVPAEPEWTSFMDYDDQYGYGYACFYIYASDEDGNYINPDSLFYRFYLDDDMEPTEFILTDANGNTYSATDIPYNYADNDFIGSGDYHVVYYDMSGFEKMGIQSVYKSMGEECRSEIIYNTVLGIKNVVNNSNVVSTSYYNLSGCRVNVPTSGVYIKRTQYSDGSVSVEKILLR